MSSPKKRNNLPPSSTSRQSDRVSDTRKSSRSNTATRRTDRSHDLSASSKRSSSSTRKPVARKGSSSLAQRIDSPWKLRLIIILSAIVVLIVLFYGIDGIRNFGKIHAGVTVSGVDVGLLTVEEATEKLEGELVKRAGEANVTLFKSDAAAATTTTTGNSTTVDLTQGVTSYERGDLADAQAQSWNISTETLLISVDGETLAQQAYGVGRGSDFFGGRLVATFGGVEKPASLVYSEAQLASLEDILTRSIGWPVVNADIYVTDEGFAVDPGKNGYVVDHERFIRSLDKAFLEANRSIVIPMVDKAQVIDAEKAAAAQQVAQAATKDPVLLAASDGEGEWQASSRSLRSWVSTYIEPANEATGTGAQLLPYFDEKKLKDNLASVVDIATIDTAAVDAKFAENENGELKIIPSETGIGVDYPLLAREFDSVAFAHGSPSEATQALQASSGVRSVVIPIGVLYPQLSTEQAKSYGINDKIATFTTEYNWTTATRIHNIHLASDYATSTLIAPGATWSFHEAVGNATAERGFQEDQAIVNDELTDAIGGGICQVATTIFNAAFEAGLPILERTNHSLYVSYYPDGRDAAVAWSSPDLKFGNETDGWMVLTLTYTSWSVTATLWGTDPGYRVEVVTGDWVEGEKFAQKEKANPDKYVDEREVTTKGKDGKSITVTRAVYDARGKLLRETAFRSVYNPVDEVTEYGTKKRPSEEAG